MKRLYCVVWLICSQVQTVWGETASDSLNRDNILHFYPPVIGGKFGPVTGLAYSSNRVGTRIFSIISETWEPAALSDYPVKAAVSNSPWKNLKFLLNNLLFSGCPSRLFETYRLFNNAPSSAPDATTLDSIKHTVNSGCRSNSNNPKNEVASSDGEENVNVDTSLLYWGHWGAARSPDAAEFTFRYDVAAVDPLCLLGPGFLVRNGFGNLSASLDKPQYIFVAAILKKCPSASGLHGIEMRETKDIPSPQVKSELLLAPLDYISLVPLMSEAVSVYFDHDIVDFDEPGGFDGFFWDSEFYIMKLTHCRIKVYKLVSTSSTLSLEPAVFQLPTDRLPRGTDCVSLNLIQNLTDDVEDVFLVYGNSVRPNATVPHTYYIHARFQPSTVAVRGGADASGKVIYSLVFPTGISNVFESGYDGTHFVSSRWGYTTSTSAKDRYTVPPPLHTIEDAPLSLSDFLNRELGKHRRVSGLREDEAALLPPIEQLLSICCDNARYLKQGLTRRQHPPQPADNEYGEPERCSTLLNFNFSQHCVDDRSRDRRVAILRAIKPESAGTIGWMNYPPYAKETMMQGRQGLTVWRQLTPVKRVRDVSQISLQSIAASNRALLDAANAWNSTSEETLRVEDIMLSQAVHPNLTKLLFERSHSVVPGLTEPPENGCIVKVNLTYIPSSNQQSVPRNLAYGLRLLFMTGRPEMDEVKITLMNDAKEAIVLTVTPNTIVLDRSATLINPAMPLFANATRMEMNRTDCPLRDNQWLTVSLLIDRQALEVFVDGLAFSIIYFTKTPLQRVCINSNSEEQTLLLSGSSFIAYYKSIYSKLNHGGRLEVTHLTVLKSLLLLSCAWWVLQLFCT